MDDSINVQIVSAKHDIFRRAVNVEKNESNPEIRRKNTYSRLKLSQQNDDSTAPFIKVLKKNPMISLFIPPTKNSNNRDCSPKGVDIIMGEGGANYPRLLCYVIICFVLALIICFISYLWNGCHTKYGY